MSEINVYLKNNKLNVEILGRGFAWLDTGTHNALLEASNFVEAIQSRQGHYIACIEEIAYNKKWINSEQLKELILPLMKTDYGIYLEKILKSRG